MNILDIRIDDYTRKEIVQKIIKFLCNNQKNIVHQSCQIFTLNPEIILRAQKNKKFREVLNNGTLNIIDGFGLQLACVYKYGKKIERFPGSDLMIEILKLAKIYNKSIFLVANKNGLSTWQETADAIKNNLKLHGIKISGINLDPQEIINYIFTQKYDIILCNFGAPDQEFFLTEYAQKKSLLCMGVGGSFDYITGRVHRAPLFMRKYGLEWFFRFIYQPRRLKRVINAVIIFPIRVIFISLMKKK